MTSHDRTRKLRGGDDTTRRDGAAGPHVAVGQTVGPYRIDALIGRGGFGSVFLATDTRLTRQVALKVPHAGSPQVLARFRVEATAVAKIEHPGVVPVYDAAAEPVPYLAMRHVEGRSLDAVVTDDGPLAPRDAARYLRDVAGGVAAAHAVDVLHRDVKPHNILLDEAADRALITDFGLAKLLDDDSGLTRSEQVLGTLAYMAPEQAGASSRVDARADVYALGATLYYLLTGQPPFIAATRVALLRLVVANPPVPPSQLNHEVDRDLEVICLHCLHKPPGGRYPTAAALERDLERYLAGEPIAARPLGPLRRLLRWCWRRPRVAASLAVAGLATVALLVTLAVSNVRVRASAAAERRARRDADTQTRRARKALDIARRQARRAAAAETETRRRLQLGLIAQGDALTASRRVLAARRRYAEAQQLARVLDASTWLADLARSTAARHAPEPALALPLGFAPVALHVLPDDRLLAVGADRAALVDLAALRPVRQARLDGPVSATAVTPDGATLAIGREDGSVLTGPVTLDGDFTPVHTPAPDRTRRVGALAYSGDGARLAIGEALPRTGATFDVRELLGACHVIVRPPHPDGPLRGHGSSITCLRFDDQTGRLLSAANGEVREWSFDGTPPPTRPFADSGLGQVRQLFPFDHERLLVVGGKPRSLILSRLATDALASNRTLRVLRTGDDELDDQQQAAVVSPDRRLLAVSDTRGATRVYDIASGRERWRLGERGPLTAVAFLGRARVATAQGSRLLVWPLEDRRWFAVDHNQRHLRGYAVSGDGRLLARIAFGRRLTLRDGRDGLLRRTITTAGEPQAVALDATGAHAAVASDLGLELWRTDGSLVRRWGPASDASRYARLALSPDARRLVVSREGSAQLRDTEGGEPLVSLNTGNVSKADQLAFLCGGRLALVRLGIQSWILDAATGAVVHKLTTFGEAAASSDVIDSADDRWLLAVVSDRAGRQHLVRWSTTDWTRTVRALEQRDRQALPHLFAGPDGRVGLVGNKGTLSILDVETGEARHRARLSLDARWLAHGPGRLLVGTGAGQLVPVDLASYPDRAARAATGRRLAAARFAGEPLTPDQQAALARWCLDTHNHAAAHELLKSARAPAAEVARAARHRGVPSPVVRRDPRAGRAMRAAGDGALLVSGWDRALHHVTPDASGAWRWRRLPPPHARGAVARSSEGLLASIAATEKVHVFDPRTTPPRWWVFGLRYARSMAFLPGRPYLVCGAVGRRLHVFGYHALRTPETDGTATLTRNLLALPPEIDARVRQASPAAAARARMTLIADQLAPSPDGRWLAVGLNVGGLVSVIARGVDGRRRVVRSVPTGHPLADAPGYLQLYAWRGTTIAPLLGQAIHARSLTALTFGANGTLASAGLDGRVRLWRIDGDRLTRVADLGPLPPARALAFADDGRLASGHDDGTIRIWSAKGAPRTVRRGHRGPINGLVWSGATLTSHGDDGELAVWPPK